MLLSIFQLIKIKKMANIFPPYLKYYKLIFPYFKFVLVQIINNINGFFFAFLKFLHAYFTIVLCIFTCIFFFFNSNNFRALYIDTQQNKFKHFDSHVQHTISDLLGSPWIFRIFNQIFKLNFAWTSKCWYFY